MFIKQKKPPEPKLERNQMRNSVRDSGGYTPVVALAIAAGLVLTVVAFAAALVA